ncbi:MAG: glycoside hydrolase family 88 protein [Paludibacteraceae bacterium]|nr:glycoside hydrolase family 88 protein [Paludibacteraceae bacterium]
MKKYSFIFLTFVLLFASCAKQSELDKAIAYSDAKIHLTMAQMESVSDSMPRNVLDLAQTTWNLRANVPQEWCGGFWDGCLWYDYALTGKEEVLNAAKETGNQMRYLATAPVFDHDLGFLVITSLLNGYRLSPDADTRAIYKEALLACADSLCTLFNPAVGTLLSWPRHVKDYGGHNTIMDNMINLELLLWAAEETGNKAYYDIAVSHADTTMAYHFREDGTSYHVAVYDPVSGKHLYNCTHQGLADSSVWARGQSWAIYGYTTMYRYTQEPRFLAFAEKVTDAYLGLLNETSEDYVPYWDFCDPRIPDAPKDASAACVVMSALLELQRYVAPDKAAEYKAAAEHMFADLTAHYESGAQCPAILLHSTGHHPAGSEIDAAIIYADYYFLEALYRFNSMKL